MTWRRLLLKNSVKNARHFLGYLLASSFAVTVFFMFSVFITNPSVAQGNMPQTARTLLNVCSYIVAVFAIFFVFYFHAALLRARSREFGLLIVLGMIPRQVGMLIFLESILLGTVSVGVGVGIGLLMSKLFLLAMVGILALPTTIPFSLSSTSFISTVLLFGLLFLSEGTISSVRTARRTAKGLLIGARTHQSVARFSPWLSVMGILCIVAAYTMSLFLSWAIAMTVVPILILISIGTYLVYRQLTVFVLTRLTERRMSGIKGLVVARFAHRMKDHARLFTVVTILTAVVLTAMGAVGGMRAVMAFNAIHIRPIALSWIEHSGGSHRWTADTIREQLRRQHLALDAVLSVPLLSGTLSAEQKSVSVTVLSAQGYQALRSAILGVHPELQKDLPEVHVSSDADVHVDVPYPLMLPEIFRPGDVTLTVGSYAETVRVNRQGSARVLNENTSSGLPDFTIIVSDRHFAQLQRVVPPTDHSVEHAFFVKDWRMVAPFVDKLTADAFKHDGSSQDSAELSDAGTTLNETDQFLSVMLFAGMFVGTLFLLATGCTIYFRMFSQQEEDRRQFRALYRIGMRRREARGMISVETLLLFLVPFLFSLIHSGVAMIQFSELVPVEGSIWGAFGIVVGLYLLGLMVFYFAARSRYYKGMFDIGNSGRVLYTNQ